jgi:PAS domain-containing protein
MVLDRPDTGSQPTASEEHGGGGGDAGTFAVSPEALQRYEEAVFRVTLDGRGTLVFIRDLTLDNSLRVALVDSRRRYKDFIEISADFTWETNAAGQFAFVPPRGA